jgi:hypothetical protein
MSPAARLLPFPVAALALAGAAGRAAAQSCAMCGSALADDPLGRAFSWSILFLMAAPYTVVGTVGIWLFLTYRRARSRQRAAIISLGRGQSVVLAPGREGEPP